MSWKDARDLRRCLNLLYDDFLPLFDSIDADPCDKLEVTDLVSEIAQLLRAMEKAAEKEGEA